MVKITDPESNDNKYIIALLGILATFAIGIVLRELREILLPFVISALLSLMFQPVMQFLKKRNVPTFIALLGVLLVVAGGIFTFTLILYSSATSLIETLPSYETKSVEIVTYLGGILQDLAADVGYSLDNLDWQNAIQISSLASIATRGLGSFMGLFVNVFLILLYLFFILAGHGQLTSKIKQSFSDKSAKRIANIIENTNLRARQYLITKTMLSLGTGVLTTIVLALFGSDFPILFGLLAFFLNFIPNIGSIVAAVLPFMLSLLQFDGIGIPIAILILLMGIQMAIGNVLEPRLMAFSLNLSPLLVLTSLIFWGWLWGLPGMVLAVPFTATIKIVFENSSRMAPVAALMSSTVVEK